MASVKQATLEGIAKELERNGKRNFETRGYHHLGGGRFADTFMYFSRRMEGMPFNARIAVKRFRAKKPVALEKEVNIWKTIDHPNIVKFLWYSSYKNGEIAMEYLGGGTLRELVNATADGLDEYTVRLYFRQLLSAIAYLHKKENPVGHKDLSPNNILLTADSQKVKITDFGLSRITVENISEEAASSIGTEGFKAPEVAGASDMFKYKLWPTDIWSLGCILVYMFVQESPMKCVKDHQLMMLTPDAVKFRLNVHATRIPKPLFGIAKLCLRFEPGKRPKASDLELKFDNNLVDDSWSSWAKMLLIDAFTRCSKRTVRNERPSCKYSRLPSCGNQSWVSTQCT